MIDLKVEFDKRDIDRIRERFRKEPARIVAMLQKFVETTTWGITRETIKALQTGDTRAYDTGNLARSTQNPEIKTLMGIIYARADYAVYVHEGTRYMRARPFFERAIQNYTPTLQTYIKSMLKEL